MVPLGTYRFYSDVCSSLSLDFQLRSDDMMLYHPRDHTNSPAYVIVVIPRDDLSMHLYKERHPPFPLH